MSEKNNGRVDRDFFGGYRPTLAGLKGKDGKPLLRKDFKVPKGGSAIRRPKPPATGKSS
jgi:hypothetical protein